MPSPRRSTHRLGSRRRYSGNSRDTRVAPYDPRANDDQKRTRFLEIRLSTHTDITSNDTAPVADRDDRVRRHIMDEINRAKNAGYIEAHNPDDGRWVFGTSRDHDQLRDRRRHDDDTAIRLDRMESELSEARRKWTTDNQKLRRRVKDVERRNKDAQNQLRKHERELNFLRPYSRNVRSRFLSTFKRDCLRAADDGDSAIILQSNSEVHEGNAAFDAVLYQSGERKDPETYKSCYGVDWQKVVKLDERSILARAISARGTVASKNKRSARFDELYQPIITGFGDFERTSVKNLELELSNASRACIKEAEKIVFQWFQEDTAQRRDERAARMGFDGRLG